MEKALLMMNLDFGFDSGVECILYWVECGREDDIEILIQKAKEDWHRNKFTKQDYDCAVQYIGNYNGENYLLDAASFDEFFEIRMKQSRMFFEPLEQFSFTVNTDWRGNVAS